MVAHPRTPVRAHRLRPLAGPRRLPVEADARGIPHSVVFEGERREIEAVQDRWRIDDEWWRVPPVSRMYYELRLQGDRVITVYRDLNETRPGGAWWLQRY